MLLERETVYEVPLNSLLVRFVFAVLCFYLANYYVVLL